MSSALRFSSPYSRFYLRSSACLSSFRLHSQDAGKNNPDHSHTASSKLLEDAAKEEAEGAEVVRKSSVVSMLESRDENWTGHEPVQHAVLRMLVDKYKPLRGGPIRSADNKLKQAPPQVRSQDTPHPDLSVVVHANQYSVPEEPPVRRYIPGEPILPGVPGHQPWHTTFTVPSHATSNIRYGNIPPPKPLHLSSTSPLPLDDKAKRKERDTQKRMQQGMRLSRARESTLDYRLGVKGSVAEQFRRPNPVTLKGWTSLVEDRIEKARMAGHFNNIQGRGKPITKVAEDRNPFINREEYLMNRIVQRQGAAPPWVEIQGELDVAVNTFREVVKQSWTRRALRTLTAMHPASMLPNVTVMRDPEWEEKERKYHEAALEEVNSLVRKYNGVAPYAVRRAYYMRGAELERVYKEAGATILQGLEERAQEGSKMAPRKSGYVEEDDVPGGGVGAGGTTRGAFRLRDLFREMVVAIRGR